MWSAVVSFPVKEKPMALWRQIFCLKVKMYEILPQVNQMHDRRKILRTVSVSCMTMSTVGDSFFYVIDEIHHVTNFV